MKSFLLPLAVVVSSAMAAEKTSACRADYVVESCLGSQRAALNACTATDYACHCTGWKNLIKYNAYTLTTYGSPASTNTRAQLLHQLPRRPAPRYIPAHTSILSPKTLY